MFAVMVIVASAASAKNRDWMDAVVSDARTGSAGAVGMTTGTATSTGATSTGMATTVAVPVDQTYYWIATKDIIYVVSCFPRAISNGWRCPNVTVHGHTRISIDGRNAHILDDDGKDRKVPIVQKIAVDKSPQTKP
jgi:hypothetical protein